MSIILSEMQSKTNKICKLLLKHYGELKCFLTHSDAFELLCAVCLSAQCTDERVNKVTPLLFAKYPDPESLAAAKQADVEKIIRSCGFYKNKAHNLIKMSQQLVSNFAGKIPNDMDSLTSLAGVGRKTANVVLGNFFNNSEGVVVDTHVKRISNLLGLTKNSDPVKIELDLSKIVPKKYWDLFSLWLIQHGRDTCIARRPRCEECILGAYCDHYLN